MPAHCQFPGTQWREDMLDVDQIVACVFEAINQTDDKDIAIVFSDDAQVQTLNRDFRGKDKTTNVLSFPSDAEDEWGDIILAYETIAREAHEQGKPFKAHLTHLIVHGVLHLLGYDHIEDDEAEEMEALEITILAQLAIDNPYEKS